MCMYIAMTGHLHLLLHLHLGHLAESFIQSDLEKVHLLKEKAIYCISLWFIKIKIEQISSIHNCEVNKSFIIARLPAE